MSISQIFLKNNYYQILIINCVHLYMQGLDLSPYFIAVAQFKDNKKISESKKVTWIHANAESTGLPSNSFDLVSISYMV